MARNPLRILGLLLTFGSITLYLGCQPSSKEEKSKSSGSENTVNSAKQSSEAKPEPLLPESGDKADLGKFGKEEKTVSKHSNPQTPPPPLTIPKVGLTDSLRATCLVNVGDTMPSGDILAADESRVPLQSLYGEKLTVVFFWSQGGSNYARLTANAALRDLETDIAVPYAVNGIKVIGINVGDKPGAVGQQINKIGVKIPCYFDENKTFFAKVAKSKLPRVYLLDASGKIIWFDTEYSQATRRNLLQAVQAVLGEK